MKKLLFMMALMFASIVATSAQERTRGDRNQSANNDPSGVEKPQSAQDMADKETQRQTKRFGLTADQVEKVKVINLNYCQQRLDLKKEAASLGSREAAANKLKEIRTAQYAELKAILTPEQQEKMVKQTPTRGGNSNATPDDN